MDLKPLISAEERKVICYGYLGLNQNMKHFDRAYEVGERYCIVDAQRLNVDTGYRFFIHPIDVLQYYPIGTHSYYVRVVARGEVAREGQKYAARELEVLSVIPEEEMKLMGTGFHVCSETGTESWYKEGKLHRPNGEPAVITPGGNTEWWVDGERHRDGDEPAVISANGELQEWWKHGDLDRENDMPARIEGELQEWYSHGLRHREHDRPAVVSGDNKREWYKNGQRHRGGGQPAIVYLVDGSKFWFVNGVLYREGELPAIECATYKAWYNIYGEKHREDDLPAVEWVDGGKEWWIDGKRHRANGRPAVEMSVLPVESK